MPPFHNQQPLLRPLVTDKGNSIGHWPPEHSQAISSDDSDRYRGTASILGQTTIICRGLGEWGGYPPSQISPEENVATESTTKRAVSAMLGKKGMG